MDDIESIRKKKLEQIQQQQDLQKQAHQEVAQIQQQVHMIESMVKPKLTREALERYGNLKTAHPEKAVQLMVFLVQAIQQQDIKKIDDAQLKELLKRMTQKRDIRITRK